MLVKEIKIGQRVYDPIIQARYIWVAGQFRTSDGEIYDNICTNCQYPSPVFLKWDNNEKEKDTAYYCVDCADIDTLQIVMVAVKNEG